MSTILPNKRLGDALKLPRQEIIAACLVLAWVVVAWTLDSFLNPTIRSTDLNIMATIVAKDMDATLFARDNLFANDELYGLYTPLYRWVIAQMWQIGGTFETGLALLVPPVLGIYLAGMFILLRWVTGNGWIALGLTVASAHYQTTMGDGVWGVGGSSAMLSRTLFMPAIPVIMLIFLHLLPSPTWRKGLVFGLILGLVTNLHPVSGFHLLALLSALLILVHGSRYQGWQTLGAIGLTAVIGAWPVTWNFIQNSGKPIGDHVTFAVFSQIVAKRYRMPFYPDTFEWPMFDLRLTRPTLDGLVWFYFVLALLALLFYVWGFRRWLGLVKWGWLIGGLITVAYAYMIAMFHMTFLFAVVAFYIVYRFWQGKYARLDGWLIVLTGLVVLYSFVGYYLLVFIWRTFEVWSLTSLLVEYARAARFVYLPIYLLAGLGGVALIKVLENNFSLVAKYGDTALPLTVAIIFGLAPTVLFGAHRQLSTTLMAIAILILLSVTIFLMLANIHWTPGKTYLSLGVVGLILFGPLGPFLTDYMPVPTRNFLSPTGWQVQSISQNDADLYDWVLQNTAPEALFYSCFEHKTLTYFRRVTQRSLTHNWKDLSFAVHNRAALISAYDKYQDFQGACSDFDHLIAAVHRSGADYLLISSDGAADFLDEACFVNEKYAVFAIDQEGCLSK